MKNYNNILEAVNRGIQLALDDFDDEEQIQNVKSKQINHRDYTKDYIDLMKDVVDLGLPSRTLWCKYNLGVNPNQLTTPEDWYGSYYAWGELEGNKTNKDGKIYFSWDNYKFGKDYDKITKYCNNSNNGLNGFTDNLTQLLPEDDTAYQTKKLHNFKFHIPTKKQYEELKNCTQNYCVKNYNPNKTIHDPEDDKGIQGLNGRVFEGQNRNQLFIPSAGLCNGFNNINSGMFGYLWTSNLRLDNSNYAYYLLSYSDHLGIYNNYRCHGYSVRPVINL